MYLYFYREKKEEKKGWSTRVYFFPPYNLSQKLGNALYIIQFPGQGPRNLWVERRFLPPLPIIPLVVGSTAISIDKNLIDTIKFHKVLSLSLSSSPKRIYIYTLYDGKKIHQGLTTVTVDSLPWGEREVKKGWCTKGEPAMTRCPIPSLLGLKRTSIGSDRGG